MKHFKLLLLMLITTAVFGQEPVLKYKDLPSEVKEEVRRSEWRQAVREYEQTPGDIGLSPIDRIYYNDQPTVETRGLSGVQLSSWGRDVMMPSNIRSRVVNDCGNYPFIGLIIDSGTDTDHTALRGPWWLTGSNYSGDPNEHWHGTHVAGIVWQMVGEVIQEHGNGKLKEVQILGGNGSGSVSNATSMVYAETAEFEDDVERGVGVFANNSWGYTGPPINSFETALQESTSKGLTWIFSGGNTGGETQSYPASTELGSAVASLTQAIRRSSFSTIGDFIDLSAPGSNINSTIPGNREASASGTSMAAPFITGLACLSYGKYGPVLQGQNMLTYLNHICTDISPNGWDKETGWGIPYVISMLETNPCDVPGLCDGEEPDDPTDPEEPTDPELSFAAGIAEDGFVIPWRTESQTEFSYLYVPKIAFEVVGQNGEMMAYTEAYEFIRAFFQNRAIVLLDDMSWYNATKWTGRFINLVSANEGLALEVTQIIGKNLYDLAGFTYAADDFTWNQSALQQQSQGVRLEPYTP